MKFTDGYWLKAELAEDGLYYVTDHVATEAEATSFVPNSGSGALTVWGLEDKPVIGVRPVNHPGVRPSKSVWRGTNAMLSWSWQGCEGNKAEVEVYSDQAEVQLLLNEKSLGRKKVKNYQ